MTPNEHPYHCENLECEAYLKTDYNSFYPGQTVIEKESGRKGKLVGTRCKKCSEYLIFDKTDRGSEAPND